ncbi:hypothetical protein [Streptomyces fuscichromogenes]|uniref:Uncharacterized protein n=1 Tax=Streptomyces fuscichromogenes TaxID=1324013 RepID=A0A917XJP2_9ACTN|nr:hypothetical protein [Streptomyces fuscichromogenes]GGN31725.1 hypothetical protein GCM10011578_069830 [Streptomyces fuscichromogenes]
MSTTRRTLLTVCAAIAGGGVLGDVFAGAVPRATTELMRAGRRPAGTRTLGEPSGAPAWYLVARDDQALPAAAADPIRRAARHHV